MRKAFLALAAVLAISVASLSTIYARAAWSQSRAQGQAAQARAGAVSALHRISAAGVDGADLQPLQARAAALGRQSPPGGSPFWDSEGEHFYLRQAAQYRSLVGQARMTLRRVTNATRQEAKASLTRLNKEIERAGALDVDSSLARGAHARLAVTLSTSRTPRQYRSVTSSAGKVLAPLVASDNQVATYVSQLLSRVPAGQTGVVNQAEAEANGAGQELDLLTLVRPSEGRYRSEIVTEVQAVRSAGSPSASAVKEYGLHQMIAAVAADYSRFLPQKMIVVSTENQSATMYQDGHPVYSTPVTTGGPELPTDHGVFHMYLKLSPFIFHSPWPIGSPYYYPPTPVQYWMPFDGGEGLHDASWRSNFGPGSNLAPTDLGTGNYILGTHGCVNLPLAAASFVWNWAPVGTTVVVV